MGRCGPSPVDPMPAELSKNQPLRARGKAGGDTNTFVLTSRL